MIEQMFNEDGSINMEEIITMLTYNDEEKTTMQLVELIIKDVQKKLGCSELIS